MNDKEALEYLRSSLSPKTDAGIVPIRSVLYLNHSYCKDLLDFIEGKLIAAIRAGVCELNILEVFALLVLSQATGLERKTEVEPDKQAVPHNL